MTLWRQLARKAIQREAELALELERGAYVDEAMTLVARRVFPRRAQPRAAWLTASAWHLVEQRQHAWVSLRERANSCRFLKASFQASRDWREWLKVYGADS